MSQSVATHIQSGQLFCAIDCRGRTAVFQLLASSSASYCSKTESVDHTSQYKFQVRSHVQHLHAASLQAIILMSYIAIVGAVFCLGTCIVGTNLGKIKLQFHQSSRDECLGPLLAVSCALPSFESGFI